MTVSIFYFICSILWIIELILWIQAFQKNLPKFYHYLGIETTYVQYPPNRVNDLIYTGVPGFDGIQAFIVSAAYIVVFKKTRK